MSSSRESNTHLMDQIRRAGDLAFGPDAADDPKRESYQTEYDELLKGTPTLLLLPALSALLQSAPPAWFKPHISKALSLLPLRVQGVRQTIEFLALMSPDLPPLAANEKGDPEISSSQGPPITPEAIKQSSNLLASVPTSLKPFQYFQGIIPQLLALLDGEGGPDLRKAAGLIVASILERKLVARKLLSQHVMRKIDPGVVVPSTISQEDGVGSEKRHPPGSSDKTLVSEAELEMALGRLQMLLSSHLSLRLTGAFVRPLMLPLWALLCYARKTKRTAWYERASTILQSYYRTTGGSAELTEISSNLLWDGRSWWTFAPGEAGGIQIRGRTVEHAAGQDIIALIEEIDLRIEEYINLLASHSIDDTIVGKVFLSASRRCLLQEKQAENPLLTPDPDKKEEMEDPLYLLINTKLVQQIPEKLKYKLTNNPTQMFELARQLLGEFVEKDKARNQKRNDFGVPSYTALGNISNQGNPSQATKANDLIEDEPIEVVSMALSLLHAILSSSDFSSTPDSTVIFSDIQVYLTYLSTSGSSIPSSISEAASALSYLLHAQTSIQPSLPINPSPPDPYVQDRKTYSLALTNLASPLPPVRAQGLSQLTSLISPTISAVLDIPATTILLLSILQDAEEFIYLSAVRALSLLANRHAKTVVRMLVERYVDPREEAGLDQRLRIGETLLQCVQDAREKVGQEVARHVAEGMLAVAGRRAKRVKTKEERDKSALVKEKKNKEAEEAWGGEVPQIHPDKTEDEDPRNEVLERIMRGWEGRDEEEDVRIRASALSVLGTAIESNIALLGAVLVSSAVDLAIAVLTLEKTNEKIILRRAAVLLILSLVKALDSEREEGRMLGFGLAGENVGDVIEVLGYVHDTDGDGMVRGHAQTVVEALHTWQEKSLIGSGEPMPRLELEGLRLRGLSVHPESQSRPRPLVEEIE